MMRRQHQDQVSVWMAWLDWTVRFVRPSWEANVTTWNLGPLGYEYSRDLLQQLLKGGQAVVMVQEMRFPLGARQRVKNELKHLHPEYLCLLEAGKDSLPSDAESMDTERLKNPWCNRGHFAVATFLHREVFKSAQRREWHTDADTQTLRHMTRGRVLRVDAELHDGQRLHIFNVHQATSSDRQLQQHTWQVLAKCITECRHQRILLGGDLNANANGLRVGYAASNADHMKRVDEALVNFVNVTQGQLMSPSAPSWRRGQRGAKLDHLITWNLSHDSNAGSLGLCWRSVGSEVPEGCTELEHPALAQRLARTTTLRHQELASLLPQGLDAQKVVRVGEQVFRPVPLGQVDWIGGPQHDHARVGFRIAPQVLAHTCQSGPQTEGATRIRLKDWQKLAPALQRELGGEAKAKTGRSPSRDS